ncbi:predicted protein, partial [Nematostella vectensis]
MANKWRTIRHKFARDGNTDFETISSDASAELCVRLLSSPSVQNFSGIKAKLKSSPSEWIEDFLSHAGMEVLFECLRRLSNRKIGIVDAFLQLECVQCIKAVMNSKAGLTCIIEHGEYSRKLVKALDTDNTMIKKQVFELLSALCLYSEQGYQLAIDALENYKMTKGQRYRFSLIVNELKNAEVVPYMSACLAFINTILISTDDFDERVRLRNEFVGLGLLDILTKLRHLDDDDLAVQIDVFEERRLDDDDELMLPEGVNLTSHIDVFHAVFKRVSDKPQGMNLLSILQNFLMIDEESPISDLVWETIEKLVKKAV